MQKNHIDKYDKKWGYELWIENNAEYCGKLLHVIPNTKCSVHYHKNKKETFYVVDGVLIIEYSDHLDKNKWETMQDIQIHTLNKGEALTIDRLTPHRFYSANNETCDFIEISTHHDENDSYRIIESQA